MKNIDKIVKKKKIKERKKKKVASKLYLPETGKKKLRNGTRNRAAIKVKKMKIIKYRGKTLNHEP